MGGVGCQFARLRGEQDHEQHAVQCAGDVGCAANGQVGEGEVAETADVWSGILAWSEYFDDCRYKTANTTILLCSTMHDCSRFCYCSSVPYFSSKVTVIDFLCSF